MNNPEQDGLDAIRDFCEAMDSLIPDGTEGESIAPDGHGGRRYRKMVWDAVLKKNITVMDYTVNADGTTTWRIGEDNG